jgi:hypothetical protein
MTSPTGVADAAILSKAEEAGQGSAHSMSLVEIETTLMFEVTISKNPS